MLKWWMYPWVLWIRYEFIGPPASDGRYQCSWVPEAAYPNDGYSQCIEDLKILANRKAEISNNEVAVKNKKLIEMVGNRIVVITELKKGGSISDTFVCFPESINPRTKACE